MILMPKPLKLSTIALLTGLLFVCAPHLALAAQTLGSMTNQLYNSLLGVQTFLSMLSYILGVFFSITGYQKLRDYVDDPGRNPPLPALLRIFAAAFFIFAPSFANIIVDAISGHGLGENTVVSYSDPNAAKGNGSGGLEASLVRFVKDFGAPFLEDLLPYFGYISGLVLMLVGLKRLALANGDGPQAPGGLGTMTTFVVAAALMAFGYIMGTLQGSIFGTTDLVSSPTFKDAGALTESSKNAIWGVFIFLRIVGYVSVLRGLFMLRGVGEGQNVSMVAVSTHMIAGAMLANATGFVLAVQETFVTDPSNYILKP
jgi:hypothetical protein